ncbi:MAG: DNA repair protein RecO [Lachnospiraceae bacterium]|nr:DNA repair protein RecO [Lachnospiraceae bacterium]
MQDLPEVNGIVLSSAPAGEADRRVTLLTAEMGKISVFARGARRPTSPLVGVTRPPAFGTFRISAGHSAYTLAGAEIRNHFEEIVKDMDRSLYASYVLELSAAFSHENVPASDLLNLLYYTLRALSRDGIPKSLVRRVFELRLLKTEGTAPDFSVCASCGAPLSEGGFHTGLMQPLCASCAAEREVLPLGKSAVYMMNHILSAPVQRLYTFSVNRETEGQAAAVADALLRLNLEYPLKSGELLALAGDQGTPG